MKNSLAQLFIRDLDRLKKEVELYTDEDTLWKVDKNISNSAGNLAIHIIGNLNHFIGAVLGESGYIRQRDNEFYYKNIPRKRILKELDVIKETVEKVILSLSENTLSETYPINIRKERMSVEQFLIHLYGHLNYHLGQINYHRRLLS